jgi:hypothetical protein
MSNDKKSPKEIVVEKTLERYQDLSNQLEAVRKYANRFHAARVFLSASHGLSREARLSYAHDKISEISTLKIAAPLCIARSKITKASYVTLDEMNEQLDKQFETANAVLEDFQRTAKICLDLDNLGQINDKEKLSHAKMDEISQNVIGWIGYLFSRHPDLAVKS